jgi:hypothetical protein
MDPDTIELSNLSKQFAYAKLASEIDTKSFCKLYYKQQETMKLIGLVDGN